MKIRVAYTVEIDDAMRRAIAHSFGPKRLATRKEIQDFYYTNGTTMDDDLRAEHAACCFGDAEP